MSADGVRVSGFRKLFGASMGGYDLSKLDVLVADDNDFMLRILDTMLKAVGITNVRRCTNSEQAYAALVRKPADIVIVDWNMAPVPGIELVRKLRDARTSPCPDAPIIMLTGHSDRDRVIEAREAGISSYLRKPVSVQVLYKRIVEIVENPRPVLRAEPAEDDIWAIG